VSRNFRLTHVNGSSKQVWQVPDAACTVFELLMMSGKTARNMYSTDNSKEYCIGCILFSLLKNTLHGHMNVKCEWIGCIFVLMLRRPPRSTRKWTCAIVTLFTTNRACIGLGVYPVLRCSKPTTSCLNPIVVNLIHSNVKHMWRKWLLRAEISSDTLLCSLGRDPLLVCKQIVRWAY
jgi:hypothetical protein